MTDINPREIETAELAANYKYLGLDRYQAWDRLIIDRGLIPGIDAKDFYKIFDTSDPIPLPKEQSRTFVPTHMDTIVDPPHMCMISQNGDGTWYIQWDTGMTGGCPPCNPPDWDRFVSLPKEQS